MKFTLSSTTYLAVFFLLFFHSLVLSDYHDCRKIEYNPQTMDRILLHHVIRSVRLRSQDMCEIRCYREPDCVSYNYGPKQNERPNCELNNRTHLQVSADEFVTKIGYTYRDVLVRERTLNYNTMAGC